VEAYRDFYGHRGGSVLGSEGVALAQAIREQRSQGREANYEMAFAKSRIERALVNDVELHLDLPRFVSWVPYLDQFVFVKDNACYRDERYQLARAMVRYETALASSKMALGVDPRTLEDFLEFVDAALGRFREIGCPAMKVHCGYVRSLRFEDVPRSTAERLFQKENLSKEEYEILQDFLMRFAMKRCGVHGLPVLVHAAMGGPMPGLILSNANCANLQNLFLDDEFRLVRFVILHGGYPFFREAGYLASTHINVYLDFSWLTFFFQSTLERIIEEWLESVPYTKLIFGTDAWSPELHWCGVTFGKRTLARVLERGPWSEDLSLKMARAILRDNAARLYGM
jgi:uncharacterized protein